MKYRSFLQPTPPHWSRRKVIQTISLGGAWIAAAVLVQRLFKPCLSINPESAALLRKRVVTGRALQLQTFQFEVVTVNEYGTITNRRPGQANFFVEDLGNGITLEMVEIPWGCFIMGSDLTAFETFNADGIPPDNLPERRVSVPAFFMGKFSVTQAQYEAVMGENPADLSDSRGASRPVVRVSWYDAAEFCSRLSRSTGCTYRLPSEAEWEYACRAGTQTPFHFGETLTTNLANYDGEFAFRSGPKGQYRQRTLEVGSFPPNGFGLYDMHGNVEEWCTDLWHPSYQGAPTDGSAWLSADPENPGESRILRGGSWESGPDFCLSGERNFSKPYIAVSSSFGFRVVAVLA